MKQSFISLAIAVGLANAVAYTVPPNAEIGSLHFPVNCTAEGVIPITLDGVYTATAPLSGESGQQIYYNDVTSVLEIPQFLTIGGAFIGVKYADIKVKVSLALSNAQPSTLDLFPNGYWINGTTFNAFGTTTVNLPPKGVLPAIGPVTLGTAGTPHTIALGTIQSEIYLYNSTGGLILGPLDITCPQTKPARTIGIVNVESASGTAQTALSPAVGAKQNFPAVADNQEFGCFRFDYSCFVGIFGPFYFDTTACGGATNLVQPGGEFSLQNITASLILPDYLIDATKNLFPGATQIDTTVNAFYLTATGASPNALNGVPAGGIKLSNQLPPAGQNLTLNIPTSGVLTAGPFTAANVTSGFAYLGTGNSTSSAIIRNSTGADIGEVGITCNPRIGTVQILAVQIGASQAINNSPFPSFSSPFSLPTGFGVPGFGK